MNVKSLENDYRRGVLVQLNDEDLLNISYGISWIKQEVVAGNFPSGHMTYTLILLEWIIKELE